MRQLFSHYTKMPGGEKTYLHCIPLADRNGYEPGCK